MFRDTIICVLILLLVLVVMAWLGGCSEEQAGGPVGPEKASVDNQPLGLVDTYILDGELDAEFPEDQQVYPYYIVRHGPEAGRYEFSEGDTVPDGAYVVLKARATTDELAPGRLGLQGNFTATGRIRGDGILFSFASTYSGYDLDPPWFIKEQRVAADTLGFEVGPFRYDVAMRGVLDLGDPVAYRDESPDTLTFHGNYPPCVQCVEVTNILAEPGTLYEDDCYDQDCLEETARLQVYSSSQDPRYGDGSDPEVLRLYDNGFMWVRAQTGEIVFEEPVDPTTWKALPAMRYSYLIYLHGKDHPREHWREGGARVTERIEAWRYQVDYQEDLNNAIGDGGGFDNIGLLSGFFVQDNEPDPIISDLYIETDPSLGGARGAWALRVTVGVPSVLLLQGRDTYWALLRAFYAVGPPPAADAPIEDVLAWQAEPATQQAYQAWKLSTMQFSPGTVRAVAVDQAPCDWRPQTSSYHYYFRTRNPTPNGRNCEDGYYEQPPEFIELGNLRLDDFAAYSNDQVPVVKHFDLELYPVTSGVPDAEPFTAGEEPPGWIESGFRELSSRASRY